MADNRTDDQRPGGVFNDTKWVVGSIIGTGGVIAALLLTLAGLTMQQNATVNARINDVHRRIDDVQSEIRGLRTDVQSEIRGLHADVQSDVQHLRADVRELRTLILEALTPNEPAD